TYIDSSGLDDCPFITITSVAVIPAVNNSSLIQICPGDSVVLPGGDTVSTDGVYVDSLIGDFGCVEIYTTTLQTVPGFVTYESFEACVGDSLMLESGGYVFSDTTIIDSLTTPSGCDSLTITTYIFLGAMVTETTLACEGDTLFLPDSTPITSDTTLIDSLVSVSGCDSIITQIYTFAEISTDTVMLVLCPMDTIELPGGTLVTEAGEYLEEILPPDEPCPLAILYIVEDGEDPTADAGEDATLCSSDELTTLTLGGDPTGSAGESPYDYNWSPPSGIGGTDEPNPTLTISPSTTGSLTYEVTVTDANGCSDIDTVIVVVNESPTLDLGPDLSFCVGLEGMLEVDIAGGTPDYEYDWTLPDASTTNEETVIADQAGTYSLVVTDSNGCEDTDEVEVEIIEDLDLSGDVTQITCNGDEDGEISVTPGDGTAPFIFDWDSGENTPDIGPLGEGTYTVIVTDANECIDEIEFEIIDPDPIEVVLDATDFFKCGGVEGEDGISTLGSVSITELTGGTPEYTYQWSNGATTGDLDLEFEYEAGEYSVLVTDSRGCSAESELMEVSVFNLDSIPQGVSPNGDGKNDYLHIAGVENFDENLVTIFNRRGTTVFQTEKYDNFANRFNGIHENGKDLPDGTYYMV
ncbi:MAG: hypothetical protein GY751_15290, partial [Bacteroidetes bacterium]|nr:hypothetical protein [Bacteroidota bacterium]